MAVKKEMSLYGKLATIQTELKAKKSRYNSFGKYNYRSAEDILEAVKPFLLDLGVSVTINERFSEIAGLPIMESIATISDGDNSIESVAIVGVDLNQRGMNVPQQFGSASSYGKKYSLGNLFLIDDTADSDATNKHDNTVAKAKPKLDVATEAYGKAVEYIRKGGAFSNIALKYDLTAEAKAALILETKV